MSVVGIDIGARFSKVAVAHRKAIQAVPNEISKLLTPTVVSFSDKERSAGECAEGSYRRNYKNSVKQVKRFLGRRHGDEATMREAADYLHCGVAPVTPEGIEDCAPRLGFAVQTCEGDKVLTAEQVTAPLLRHIKGFTSAYLEGLSVKDCVVACPTYFDDAQRRALLRAAHLADLNVLRLMNETTAVALNYGILRDLPETETRRVIFVDVGYSNTQVAVVDFQHGKLQVHLTTHEANLGSRDFDQVLFDKYSDEFESKYKMELKSRLRSTIRLWTEVEKIKKILSANRDAPLHIECFVDEIDFDHVVTRVQFEEMVLPLTARLQEFVAQSVQLMTARDSQKAAESLAAKKKKAATADKSKTKAKGGSGKKVVVHSVEIVGGGSRIPCVQKAILCGLAQCSETAHVKSLNTTLNGNESVSRGCALMCAMLSPNFRVRQFEVQDINGHPLELEYKSAAESSADAGEAVTQAVLRTGHPCPCSAKVNVKLLKTLSLALRQSAVVAPTPKADEDTAASTPQCIDYAFATQRQVARLRMTVPSLRVGVQPPKLKMVVQLNRNGLLDLPKATLLEWVEEDVKVEVTPPPTPPVAEPSTDEAKKQPVAEESTDATPMEVDSEDASAATQSTDSTTDEAMADAVDGDAAADAQKSEAKEPEFRIEKRKKKISSSLTITGKFLNAMTASGLEQWSHLEAAMNAMDNLVRETAEARNALESYVFDMRHKCGDSHRDFIAADARSAFMAQLDATEEWLYDEGEDAGKTVFGERMAELQKIGGPVLSRAWEFEHRPARVAALKKLAVGYQRIGQLPTFDFAAAKQQLAEHSADATADTADVAMDTEATDATEASATQAPDAEATIDKPVIAEADIDKADIDEADEGTLLEAALATLSSDEEKKFFHISKEDKATVLAAANACDEWLANHCIKQERLSKAQKPAMSCADIDAKYRELLNACQPLVTKPRPKPKPKPKPKKKKKTAEVKADDAKADEAKAAETLPETEVVEEPPADDSMDVE